VKGERNCEALEADKSKLQTDIILLKKEAREAKRLESVDKKKLEERRNQLDAYEAALK